jgi:hypothetical protein
MILQLVEEGKLKLTDTLDKFLPQVPNAKNITIEQILSHRSEGEGDAFFKLGDHQFLAMFKVEEMKPDRMRHFGIMVRDEGQLAEVREKITKKYGLKLIPGFRCDFRDPFGNRIQVVDLHDESLVWLLPYQEVQKAGIKFSG